MRVQIEVTKRNLAATAAVAVLSALAHKICGISVGNMALFPVVFLAVSSLDIMWNEKYGWLFSTAALVFGSVFSTWLVQYLLLAEDLRSRISQQMFWLNICCSLCIYLLAQICVNHTGVACMASHTVILTFAGVNYFVYQFRGNELLFGDIKSALTGLSVASHYQFSFPAQAVNTMFATMLFFTGVVKLRIRSKEKLVMRLLCLSAFALSVMYITDQTENTLTETWEQKGTYQNGFLLNFALSVRDSFIQKPDAYSETLIGRLETEYASSDAYEGDSPTVIVIMNESFADLSVAGDLWTNEPVMPFVESLKENTVKGYVLASVYGAKTPNSEWEFLTGNSMGFLPIGSVPYQQYVEEENAYSVLDAFHKQGYTCVAMHPYYETGWSRDAVYPQLGFDETYFLDDFDQSSLMRSYVPDTVMYDKLIERYEAAKGKEKLFLMGVTMQNHGGYLDTYENFTSDVYGVNIRYPDVNQYLSLIRQSDLAIQKLIDYFSQVDKPVAICFFGDHQPSLNQAFYQKLNGRGLSGLTLSQLMDLYKVPFFIWTNYKSESRVVECTSLNFLSTMLLEQANLALPPYHLFLNDLMEEVPAMNARGYYSKSRGRFVHYGEGDVKEEAWIKQYECLQYNGLFDDKKRSPVFFEHTGYGAEQK